MAEVRKEINKQLLEMLKYAEEIKDTNRRIALLSEIASVHKITNR